MCIGTLWVCCTCSSVHINLSAPCSFYCSCKDNLLLWKQEKHVTCLRQASVVIESFILVILFKGDVYVVHAQLPVGVCSCALLSSFLHALCLSPCYRQVSKFLSWKQSQVGFVVTLLPLFIASHVLAFPFSTKSISLQFVLQHNRSYLTVFHSSNIT